MTTNTNRRYYECLARADGGRMWYRLSVPLSKAELRYLPAGTKRRTRTWFTSRQAARNAGLRSGRAFVVRETDQPDAPF